MKNPVFAIKLSLINSLKILMNIRKQEGSGKLLNTLDVCSVFRDLPFF